MAFVVANPAKTDARVPARLPQCPSKAFYRGGRCSRMPVTGLGQLPPRRPKPNLRLFYVTLLDFAIDVEGNSTTSGSIPSILYPRIVGIVFFFAAVCG